MQILITGGLGYIGSHTALNLLSLNYEVIIIDDLSNSSYKTKALLEQISKKKIKFYNQKIQDKQAIKKVFLENKIDFVMHFAGLKSVTESVKIPLNYYEVNISGSINLINAMKDSNVNKMLFSSSATVYKNQPLPWNEETQVNIPFTPYGLSKIFTERIFSDASNEINDFRLGILRYFNPIGAHKSGLIGEEFNNKSKNLIPNILRVIDGKQDVLNVYGNDYKTPDGTCIRDYFHINDLVNGQIRAMDFINENPGLNIWNLGSGKGYSTLEIIKMFEKKINKNIPIQFHKRRKGDLDKFWCDPSKARKELDWKTYESLDTMVTDILYFYEKNKER